MQLDRQPERARGLEDTAGLRRREGDALAEHVDRVDQALALELRQPGADGVDVLVLAAFEFRRQRMRAQAGGAHRQAQPGELARHPQALRLVRQRQAVAGLHLQRGQPLGHQRAGARRRQRPQRLLVGGARRGDGGADAAAGAGDLLIGRALQAQLEFRRSLAAVDQVRVAVDQPGRHQRAAEVVRVGDAVAPLGRQLRRGADPAQLLSLDQQRAVVHQSPVVLAGEGRQRRVGPQGAAWRGGRGHGHVSLQTSHQAGPC